MPGHTRSIYSRRQRLGPARFDNPLADFLDRLPDYFNDYQRNQLALERQQLADKRYEDSQRIAEEQRLKEESRYQDGLKQRQFANEIALIKGLPESARAKAMMSSENEDIQEAGRIAEEEANAFDAMLKPPDPLAPTNELLSYYNSLETTLALGEIKLGWIKCEKDNGLLRIVLYKLKFKSGINQIKMILMQKLFYSSLSMIHLVL